VSETGSTGEQVAGAVTIAAVVGLAGSVLAPGRARAAVCTAGPVYRTHEEGVCPDDPNASVDLAALLDAVPSGAVIEFSPGTYDLSSWTGYALSKSIRFTAYEGSVVLEGPGSSQTFLSISEEPGALSRIAVENLAFDDWGTAIELIHAQPLASVVVRGCRFTNVTHALRSPGVAGLGGGRSIDHVEFSRCEVADCGSDAMVLESNFSSARVCENRFRNIVGSAIVLGTSASGFGAEDDLWAKATVSHNSCVALSSAGMGASVHGIFAAGRELTICHNHVESVENGGGPGAEGIHLRARYADVSGNILRDAGGPEGAIHLAGSGRAEGSPDSARGYGNRVCHNTVVETRPGDRSGIHVEVEDVLVAGNRVEGGQCGISALVTSPDALLAVEGNQVRDSAKGLRIGWQGLMLTVSRNTIALDPTSDLAGIELDLGGSSTRHDLRIDRNIIIGAPGIAASGIEIIGSATVDGLVIWGNQIAAVRTGIHTTFGSMPSFASAWIRGNYFRRNLIEIAPVLENLSGSVVIEGNRAIAGPSIVDVPATGVVGAAVLGSGLLALGVREARRAHPETPGG
jgi:hypothetical protein